MADSAQDFPKQAAAERSRRKRIWLLCGVLLTLAALALLIVPRVMRCVVYHKLVAAPGASENLATRPQAVTIDDPADVVPLSLGYAETALPREWSEQISIKGTAVVVSGGEGAAIAFLPPFFDSSMSRDGNYTWDVAVAQTRRRSLWSVALMSAEEYERLAARTLLKSIDTYNQNGIGLFETAHIRGMIRLGPRANPGHVNLAVWSKSGPITQGILIHAPDAEIARHLAQCVLSRLKYTVDRVPAEGEIRAMIHGALHGHDLLVDEPAQDE